nr:hypothetical protein [Sinobaca sp. H24]
MLKSIAPFFFYLADPSWNAFAIITPTQNNGSSWLESVRYIGYKAEYTGSAIKKAITAAMEGPQTKFKANTINRVKNTIPLAIFLERAVGYCVDLQYGHVIPC